VSSPTDQLSVNANPPAPAPRVLVKVRYCRGGLPIAGLITGRRVFGALCHWDGRVTRPHLGGEFPCEWCKKPQRPFWRGFLSAYDPRIRLHFVFILTANGVGTAPDLDRRSGADLRGRTLTVQPATRDEGAHQVCTLGASAVASYLVPDAAPVRRVLERMWRLPDNLLGEDEES